jgi:hypothetical protein
MKIKEMASLKVYKAFDTKNYVVKSKTEINYL